MSHAPDAGQGSLFAAEPNPAGGHGIDPHIRMGNHAYVRRDARPTSQIAAAEALPRSGTQRARVLDRTRETSTGKPAIVWVAAGS